MTRITIQPEGQLTIPAEILSAWRLTSHGDIDVQLVNGVIMLIPWQRRETIEHDILSYAGMGHGLWGQTPEATENSIHELRHSWNR